MDSISGMGKALPELQQRSGEAQGGRSGSSPAGEKAASSEGTAPEGELRDWTILSYMNGNDKVIEGDVLNAFLFMEQQSRPGKYAIVSEFGRAPQSIVHSDNPAFNDKVDGDWDGVRRYEVKNGEKDPYGHSVWTSMGQHDGKIDSKLIENLGSLDMSSPKVLEDFLAWGIKKYPARHYAIVLAGHGNGFLGTQQDYHSHGRDMSLENLDKVFENVREQTGVKPDVLFMDACLMSQAEAVYQIRDTAKYMVGSENVNYNCLAYFDFLKDLNDRMEKGENVTSEMMATGMVKAASGHDRDIPTISALNLEKVESLSGIMKELASALLSTTVEPSLIRDAMDHSVRFIPEGRNSKPLSDYRDLYSLAENLQADARIGDQTVKNAAQKIMKLIENDIVLAEHHKESGLGKESIHGLTVYMPVDGFPKDDDYSRVISTWKARDIKPEYLSLDLVKETGWDKVIEKCAGPPKPLPPSNDWY